MNSSQIRLHNCRLMNICTLQADILLAAEFNHSQRHEVMVMLMGHLGHRQHFRCGPALPADTGARYNTGWGKIKYPNTILAISQKRVNIFAPNFTDLFSTQWPVAVLGRGRGSLGPPLFVQPPPRFSTDYLLLRRATQCVAIHLCRSIFVLTLV